VYVNITLSIEDRIVEAARHKAEALGTSVDKIVTDYLERLAGTTDPGADAPEFERLSLAANGRSNGWKFNRDEIHERR
jgi:hypothetical protein